MHISGMIIDNPGVISIITMLEHKRKSYLIDVKEINPLDKFDIKIDLLNMLLRKFTAIIMKVHGHP